MWQDDFIDILKYSTYQDQGVIRNYGKSFLQLAAWFANNILKAELGIGVSKTLSLVKEACDTGYLSIYREETKLSMPVVKGFGSDVVLKGTALLVQPQRHYYTPSDIVDPDDMEFWLEGFDWAAIRSQIAAKKKTRPTFRTGKLSFKLEVVLLTIDAEWTITLKHHANKVLVEQSMAN